MDKNKFPLYASYVLIGFGIIFFAIYVLAINISPNSGVIGAIFLVAGAYFYRKLKDNKE